MGGLLLAVALSRHPDIQVDVYEGADSLTEPGAGVGLWPRTWKIMDALDLQEELIKVAIVPPEEVSSQLTSFPTVNEFLTCCLPQKSVSPFARLTNQ